MKRFAKTKWASDGTDGRAIDKGRRAEASLEATSIEGRMDTSPLSPWTLGLSSGNSCSDWASASFGSLPAIVRRGWPPPQLATSGVAIALRSSTVSSWKRFALAACDFLAVVDDRMKSPKSASCARSPRRTGINPSGSATWIQPKNAGSCELFGG